VTHDALPTRRSFLQMAGVLATTALAGCTSLFGGDTTELVVHNDRETAIDVTVSVANDSQADPVLDETSVSVEAGAQTVVSDEIPRLRGHVVTVDVADDAPPETFRAEKPTAALHVYVGAEGMEFVAGARN
jgi:hypothetical protein